MSRETVVDARMLPDIVADANIKRRNERLRDVNRASGAREFLKRRDGMIYAMDGGLWLHRHVWQGRPMVHLVSTDRVRLIDRLRARTGPFGVAHSVQATQGSAHGRSARRVALGLRRAGVAADR